MQEGAHLKAARVSNGVEDVTSHTLAAVPDAPFFVILDFR